MSRNKGEVPHDRLLLSKAVAERWFLKISFPDGEYLIDQLRWHTLEHLGLVEGKVVNLRAVKYWEILEDYQP